MGPKSILDTVGGVFVLSEYASIKHTRFSFFFVNTVFHSSPPSADLVSVKQCKQRNRVGHIYFCTAVTICSVTIHHAPSGKFKQNVIP
jgi:hypothetical protein